MSGETSNGNDAVEGVSTEASLVELSQRYSLGTDIVCRGVEGSESHETLVNIQVAASLPRTPWLRRGEYHSCGPHVVVMVSDVWCHRLDVNVFPVVGVKVRCQIWLG